MEKTVVARLRLEIDQYLNNARRASGATKELGREISGVGQTSRRDLDQVGRGALLMAGGLTVGLGLVTKATMGFDKQLSELGAVSSATGDEMGKLRDQALEAGAATQYSAAQAAEAQTELAKAGVSTADILGGALDGALALAAAGGLDLAQAAEIAATSMTTFGLAGKDVTHIADVLAAGANKSAADVDEMAMALSQTGLVADQFGLDLEDTVGTLSLFAQSGLRGSDAGTSFKTMLQRLVPTSKEAAEKMEELGIDMFDAQGKFIGIDGAAQELKTSLAGLTEEERNAAMATIFGSDAVRAATVLYEAGAAGVEEWVEKVDDAGFASEVAGKRMDNLSGDLEALRGSIETTLIEGGSHATGVLRFMTQETTNLVNGFGQMPAPLQAGAVGFAAVTAAGAGLLGTLAYVAPRLREAREALDGMGAGGQFLNKNLGRIAGSLGVIGAGVAVFAVWEGVMADATARGEELSKSWRDLAYDTSEFGTGLDAFKANLSAVNHEWGRMSDEATSSKAPWDADKRAELQAGADELKAIGDEMGRTADLADDLAGALGISGDAALEFILDQQAAGVDILAENYGKVRDSLIDTHGAMTTGTVASHELSAGMDVLGSEVASVEDQVAAFNDTLDALFDSMFGAEAASDALQSALNGLPDVLKEARDGGLNLNEVLTSQSDQAIAVREHMRGMIGDASALVEQWHEQGVTGDELKTRIDLLSLSFADQATKAGLPAPVVQHYLELLAEIPASKQTTVTANTTPAADAFRRLIDSIPKTVTVTVNGRTGTRPNVDYRVGAATGGVVGSAALGPPQPSDTVPMALTPGEGVVTVQGMSLLGEAGLHALNRGQAPLLGGGTISPSGGPGVASGGTTRVTFTGDIVLGQHRLGSFLVDELVDFQNNNGYVPIRVLETA